MKKHMNVCLAIVIVSLSTQGCRSVSQPRVMVDLRPNYQELFDEALSTQSGSVRYVCLMEIAKGDDDAMALLSKKLTDGTAHEREQAALVLRLVGTPSALRKSAAYYVSKIKDKDYFPTGTGIGLVTLPGMTSWIVDVETDGVLKHRTISMSGSVQEILAIGREAVPSLVETLVSSKDVRVQQNALWLLHEITKKDIPFDIRTGSDRGVRELLLREGWLSAERGAAELPINEQ